MKRNFKTVVTTTYGANIMKDIFDFCDGFENNTIKAITMHDLIGNKRYSVPKKVIEDPVRFSVSFDNWPVVEGSGSEVVKR